MSVKGIWRGEGQRGSVLIKVGPGGQGGGAERGSALIKVGPGGQGLPGGKRGSWGSRVQP